jgi:putative ABC transport system permease protein
MTTAKAGMEFLYNNQKIGTDLRVVGIIRPNEEASSAILTGTIAYTAALSDYALQKTQSSELLKAQLANPSVDALTGLPFATAEDREPTAAEIREAVTAFMAGLTTEKKAEIYTTLLSTPTAEQTATFVEQQMSMMTPENIRELLIAAFSTQIDISMEELASYVDNMDAATQAGYAKEILAAGFAEQFAAQVKAGLAGLTAEQIAAMYDLAAPTLTEENYQFLYENFLPKRISDSTYDDNLLALGYVREESPASIYLYASSFENKDEISALIEKYNDSVEEEEKISYTDYVALLMSSITTIVNAISYVLIAFVAISLIVSSIMIGIITYISVLERTKEIGILRAIGASKKDIRRVFNAETLLIGFVSGALGIAVTLGGNLLINKILLYFTGIPNLRATLPVAGAVVLVIISMMLTLIAGLFPSGVAAKKNPVEALRSE